MKGYQRNRLLTRVLALMMTMQNGRHTLEQLAVLHKVNKRTIRRDIYAMEEAGIPVMRDEQHEEARWWIVRTWQRANQP